MKTSQPQRPKPDVIPPARSRQPAGLAGRVCLACCTVWLAGARPGGAAIDRHALVERHPVVLRQWDAANPLSVGNGGFAFTVDATGLQTFPEAYTATMPLGTLSDWGWHTSPNPHHWSLADYPFKLYPDLTGRLVPYADVPGNRPSPESQWLRANPHRLDLGVIGFSLRQADGSLARTQDVTGVRQTLDLWTGIIQSHFEFDGQPVEVATVANPDQDGIAVRVRSPWLAAGRLAVRIRFPYGTAEASTLDWNHPDAHETVVTQAAPDEAHFARRVDADRYVMDARWSSGARLQRMGPHEFEVGCPPAAGAEASELEFSCAFAPQSNGPMAGFDPVAAASRRRWQRFWQTGGAVDLSGSRDPRWFELERRIVLSQYLTAIQSAAAHPPAETGLTCDSWSGKFHLEMHWWHEAHFALWGRLPLLERSLGFYQAILPEAEATARRQGYRGARWPKMTTPAGVESPSPVGPFLIWQEPHPIFFAELCRRSHPGAATLKTYAPMVFATADFMASYAAWDARTGRYVLGPTLQCAQEIFPKSHTLNPAFELTYWRWGLETAQQWRVRMGLAREPAWDRVLARLARPVVAGGRYLFTESTPDSYENPRWNNDHPAVLGALSFVPGPGIDAAAMRATLDWVWAHWNWPHTWGWDYPLMAMTAARLGEPDRAVDALLLDTPKNRCAVNGQFYQRPGLPLYLPANGGLLYAVALMAAGWDGGPGGPAPGFPADGSWRVRWEGLQAAP